MIESKAGPLVCVCGVFVLTLIDSLIDVTPSGPGSEKKLHSRFSAAERSCCAGE